MNYRWTLTSLIPTRQLFHGVTIQEVVYDHLPFFVPGNNKPSIARKDSLTNEIGRLGTLESLDELEVW